MGSGTRTAARLASSTTATLNAAPNGFLAEMTEGLRPGRALDVGNQINDDCLICGCEVHRHTIAVDGIVSTWVAVTLPVTLTWRTAMPFASNVRVIT